MWFDAIILHRSIWSDAICVCHVSVAWFRSLWFDAIGEAAYYNHLRLITMVTCYYFGVVWFRSLWFDAIW